MDSPYSSAGLNKRADDRQPQFGRRHFLAGVGLCGVALSFSPAALAGSPVDLPGSEPLVIPGVTFAPQWPLDESRGDER
jgi:hypothetical protein